MKNNIIRDILIVLTGSWISLSAWFIYSNTGEDLAVIFMFVVILFGWAIVGSDKNGKTEKKDL